MLNILKQSVLNSLQRHHGHVIFWFADEPLLVGNDDLPLLAGDDDERPHRDSRPELDAHPSDS